MAHSAVFDGKLKNEALTDLEWRFDQIKRCLNEGTLSLPFIMIGLQRIIERCTSIREFPIWRTVTLGTHESTDELLKAMKEAGCHDSALGNYVLSNVVVRPKEKELDLVVLTATELGFKDSAQYAAICTRAQEVGLLLCPSEVGPQLRLQYVDQPFGDELLVAMKPLSKFHSIFRVAHIGDFGVAPMRNIIWLDAALLDSPWRCDTRFIFVRPRRSHNQNINH